MTDRTKQLSILGAILAAGIFILWKLLRIQRGTLSDQVFAAQDYSGAPLQLDSVFFPRLGLKQGVPDTLSSVMPPSMPIQQGTPPPAPSADVGLPENPPLPAPVAATNPCCDECSQFNGTPAKPRTVSDLSIQRALQNFTEWSGRSTTATPSPIIGGRG